MANEELEKNYQAYKEEAEAAFDSGNAELAISIYENAMVFFPEDPHLRVDLGNIFLKLGCMDKAESCYTESLNLDSGFCRGLHGMAMVFSNKGLYKEAIDYYYMAIDTGEATYGTFNNLGNIYIELKEFEKAEIVFKKGLECSGSESTALYNLGRAYAHQKKYEQALKYTESSVNLLERQKVRGGAGFLMREKIHQENLFMQYRSLAKICMELGLQDKIDECFEKCRSLNVDNYSTIHRLAYSYFERGIWEKAVEVYKELSARYPDSDDLWRALVQCYIELGRPEEQLVYMEKIVQKNPEDIESFVFFIQDALALKRFDLVLQYTEGVNGLYPDNQAIREIRDKAHRQILKLNESKGEN